MKLKKFFMENKKALLLVLTWLIFINVFSLLALNRLNLKADDAYPWIPVNNYSQGKGWNVVNMHSRWDSNWYLDIAKNGYQMRENDTLSNVVFFPVYPMSIRMFSIFVGHNFILTGWVISCLFLFLAAIFLFKLAASFHGELNPLLAVFLMLIFPTACFFNSVYTESLFLFLSVGSFYLTMKKRYFSAALFGLIASLTRVTGILLFAPLLIQLFLAEGFNRRAIAKSLPFALIPLGTLSLFTYHWWRFGNFFLFFKIENAWGRSFNYNIGHFLFDSSASIANFSLDLFYLLFVLLITLILARKKHFAYAFYVGSTFLVAISTGTLMSIGRYILVLFPVYLVGASLKNDLARYAWIMISASLMALNAILFINWYWAG